MTHRIHNQQAVIEEPLIVRRHILDLLLPFIWALIMLLPASLSLIALDSLGVTTDPIGALSTWIFSGLYFIFVISFFMTEWTFWYQDAWIITHDRLIDIALVSLFNRRLSQLSFNQVQDIQVEMKGYLQNIFNYGNINVQSAGRQSFFQLQSVPRPAALASKISDKSLMSQNKAPLRSKREVRVIKPSNRIGEILVAEGLITNEDLIKALQLQPGSGKKLGEILEEAGKINRSDIVQALASQYRIPGLDLSRYDLDGDTVRLFSKEIAAEYMAIAVDKSPDGVISVAMAHPSSDLVAELMSKFDEPLTFMVADEDYIREAIRAYYPVELDNPNSN